MFHFNYLKKISKYSIVSMLALIFPLTAYAADYTTSDYITNEKFDSYPTNSIPAWWVSDTTGGTITVAPVPSSSDKSIYLNDTSTSSFVNFSSVVPTQTESVTAQFSVMLPIKVNNHKLFRLISNDGRAAASIETIGGNISYRNADNSYQTIVSDYGTNTWYTIKIEANISSKKCNILLNGNKILSNVAFYSGADNIARMESYTTNSGTGSFYLDGIKLYAKSTVTDPDIIVAQDGSGRYTTVQKAVDAASPGDVIFVKNGTYKEVVTVNTANITIVGESSRNTVITYDNSAGTTKPDGSTYGTSGCATMFVKGSGFTGKNITIENSYDESKNGASQAVAAYVSGDKSRFAGCRILGNQDTLYAGYNRQYYSKCYIEGDVDFIFGGATAVFDDCEIFSVPRTGGYITAASTSADNYGYLFNNCRVKGATPDNATWLGRPWRANAYVVYKNCYLGAHIRINGWTDMSNNKAANARFYEFGSTGPGAHVNSYRKQLTSSQASSYTKSNYLTGSDGWNP